MIDKITIAVDSMEHMVAFYSAVLNVQFSKRELFGRTLYGARYRSIELLLCPKDLAGVDANVNTAMDTAGKSCVHVGNSALAEA